MQISDSPFLQAEDDGFLLHLKWEILDSHIQTLGIPEGTSLGDSLLYLIECSESATDSGSCLPLYLPWHDDDGIMRGSKATNVWSGAHIDIPLYGDLVPQKVERLIFGGHHSSSKLHEGFMSYTPAFRVALLVHHICQIVLINPLAAEAFVLGKYDELPFNDAHYLEYGIPSTELVSVEPNSGTNAEWMSKSPNTLSGSIRSRPRINGWRVRFRGSQPKESWMHDAWQQIRDSLDEPLDVPYTMNGKPMRRQEPAPSGRSRKRVGDPDVDLMYEWAQDALESGTFPMRGSFKDWKQALGIFAKEHPFLADRWTSDSMRKAYERRNRRGR